MRQTEALKDFSRRQEQLGERKVNSEASTAASLSSSSSPSSSRVELGISSHGKSIHLHDLSGFNLAAPLGGAKMQRMGIGTHKLTGKNCVDAVSMAIKQGYRLIDTARCYKNEEAIAEALRNSDVPRNELFITSKIDTKEMKSAAATTEAVMKALNNLKVQYLDLMLLHWPGVKGLAQDSTEHRIKRFEAYKALVKARNEGYIRHIGTYYHYKALPIPIHHINCQFSILFFHIYIYIGVSNFLKRHIEELTDDCQLEGIDDHVPYLNQLELHPLCQQRETVAYCKQKGILVQAYSSLGTGQLLSNETLVSVAKHYDITVSQLLLLWALYKNVYVIPKSSREERLRSNYNVLYLCGSLGINIGDIATLDAMEEDHHFCWNPVNIR